MRNGVFSGAEGKKSLIDLNIPINFNGKIILFIHGFMGYKDWGCWNLVENYFVTLGYGFCKYNVSHNGGTIENGIDFSDLDAFSVNSYYKEYVDTLAAISYIKEHSTHHQSISLIGHSRGGGMALLQSTNETISAIVSWAGISSIEKRFPTGEALKKWKEKGVKYHLNSRTNQQMPSNYLQFEEFCLHKEQLNIESSCKNSLKPTLLIHGDHDTSVPIEEGHQLANWLNTKLHIIENGDHTFGSKQPWTNKEMPEQLLQVCKITAHFFEMTLL
jgi:dipeptidyl aminopeptidase/acylaminoacyl peptidase